MGAENLAPSGIQSLEHPACSVSLYRLRYPGPRHEVISALSLDSLKPRTCMLGWYCSVLQDPITEQMAYSFEYGLFNIYFFML